MVCAYGRWVCGCDGGYIWEPNKGNKKGCPDGCFSFWFLFSFSLHLTTIYLEGWVWKGEKVIYRLYFLHIITKYLVRLLIQITDKCDVK